MEDLKERAVRGGVARVGARVVNFVIRIGTMMVLSRLLDPSDFGLTGMVTAFTGILGLFNDFGLSSATIQSATVTDRQKSALFWINVALGTVLGLVALAASPVLVAFYHEPRLFRVTMVLAAQFPVSAAGAQHHAVLERTMRFVTLSIIEVGCLLMGGIVGLAMAVSGYGYWALVGASLSSVTVSTICAWLASGWIPRAPRRESGIRPMLRFGGLLTLNTLVVYVANNLEKALLGRFWGADALGLYGRAYQVVNIPIDNLNSSVGGIAFSALSRLQDQPSRFRSYFLKGYSLVLAMTLPITVACAIFANELVFVVLGPKWAGSVALLRLLSPTILIFAVVNPLGWLLMATGRVGRGLCIALACASVMVAGYVVGIRYGPRGVATALSVSMAVWMIPHIVLCTRRAVVSPLDLFRTARRPLLSALAAAALALPVELVGARLPSPILRLALGTAVLGGSYLWMLLYIMKQRSFYLDLLKGFWKPRMVAN
jgi:PST family polysaccharide transporter